VTDRPGRSPRDRRIIAAVLAVGLLAGLYLVSTRLQVRARVDRERQAIELVMQRQDVREWLGRFGALKGTNPSTGGHPAIRVYTDENGATIVHLYESTPTHNATFNRYRVDLKNRRVEVALP